jgi:two-component system sensor histidine kinase YesM
MVFFYIPFFVFFGWYNAHAVNVVNDRIAENTKSKIMYYEESSETLLKYVETFMVNTVANDGNFRQLEFKLSELDAHLNTYEILQKYQTVMTLIPAVRSMYVYTVKNNLYRKVYTYNFPFRDKEIIDEYIKEKVFSSGIDLQKWTIERIGSNYYLLRILGINDTYCISLVDVNSLYMMEKVNQLPNEHLIYLNDNLSPATFFDDASDTKIDFSKMHPNKKYTIIKGNKRYFFVCNYSTYLHLYLVSCAAYSGLLRNMDKFQFILLVMSIIFGISITVCLVLLNRLLVTPLAEFVTTMTEIKRGQINSRLRMSDRIVEFSKIGIVFNEMMDEITKLKIEKYEQQMNLQKIEMQRLQMQIRPHFYLNCMKILYGMAEQKQYGQIQEMILSLSDYLRVLFKNQNFTVPVNDELQSVEKFVTFQKKCGNIPPLLSVSVDDSVKNFSIPSMSILTFVENTLKYAQMPGKNLKIRISVKQLESDGESVVNITISDNGCGFSEESLNSLNQKIVRDNNSCQIGIMNIRRRFDILYGDKYEMLFMNQNGARIEIFIPLK